MDSLEVCLDKWGKNCPLWLQHFVANPSKAVDGLLRGASPYLAENRQGIKHWNYRRSPEVLLQILMRDTHPQSNFVFFLDRELASWLVNNLDEIVTARPSRGIIIVWQRVLRLVSRYRCQLRRSFLKVCEFSHAQPDFGRAVCRLLSDQPEHLRQIFSEVLES